MVNMHYYVPKMNFSLGSESQTNKVKKLCSPKNAPIQCATVKGKLLIPHYFPHSITSHPLRCYST